MQGCELRHYCVLRRRDAPNLWSLSVMEGKQKLWLLQSRESMAQRSHQNAVMASPLQDKQRGGSRGWQGVPSEPAPKNPWAAPDWRCLLDRFSHPDRLDPGGLNVFATLSRDG